MRFFTTVLLTTLALMTGACSPEPPELEPLITPNTSSLEPVVQTQFAEARRNLEEASTLTDSPRISAEFYGQLGRLYFAYGLVDAAEPALVNAARLQPDEYVWHYLLGHLYFSRDTDLAAEHLNRALKTRQHDVPTLVTLGLLELERGHADVAQQVGDRILEHDPQSAAGYYLSGRAALLTGNYETAVARLEKVLEIDPEADRTYHPLAQAYRALGMTNEAVASQQRAGSRAVTIKDDLFGGLKGLRQGSAADIGHGRDALRQGHPDVAVTWLRKALDANPEDASGWLLLGTALGEMEQLQESREAFQKVLRITPDYPAALMNIGSTWAREGNDTEAIAWYRKAIAQDPNVEGSYLNLANALERTHRCNDALAIYEKAWLQDQADPRPRLGAANCLTAVGYHAQALRSLEAGVAALPTEPVLIQALAHYLLTTPVAALRDPARALTLAREAAAMVRTPATLATHALALANTGDFAAAIETQQAAIDAAEQQGLGGERRNRLVQELITYEAGLLPQNP